jgi:hypothetical protein
MHPRFPHRTPYRRESPLPRMWDRALGLRNRFRVLASRRDRGDIVAVSGPRGWLEWTTQDLASWAPFKQNCLCRSILWVNWAARVWLSEIGVGRCSGPLREVQEHPGFHPGLFAAVPTGTESFSLGLPSYVPGYFWPSLSGLVPVTSTRLHTQPCRATQLKSRILDDPISGRRNAVSMETDGAGPKPARG